MQVQWKTLNLNQWERRDTFLGFKDFEFPYSVIGVEVDISKAILYWKEKQLSPFLSLVYAVCRTSNAIPAFRQRIRGDQVIEHEKIHADFCVPSGTESFTIKLVEYCSRFQDFYTAASGSDRLGWSAPGSDGKENDHWVYMSSLPWIRFNHVVQPVDKRSGSIPRIVWGRFTPQGDRTLLPLSIQTHHGLVDGLHVARFLEHFEGLLANPEQTYSE